MVIFAKNAGSDSLYQNSINYYVAYRHSRIAKIKTLLDPSKVLLILYSKKHFGSESMEILNTGIQSMNFVKLMSKL